MLLCTPYIYTIYIYRDTDTLYNNIVTANSLSYIPTKKVLLFLKKLIGMPILIERVPNKRKNFISQSFPGSIFKNKINFLHYSPPRRRRKMKMFF